VVRGSILCGLTGLEILLGRVFYKDVVSRSSLLCALGIFASLR
jgi:hypothetical protein